jgi:hypothetical protein
VVSQHTVLDDLLAALKSDLRLESDHTFKFVHSSARTRKEFLERVLRAPVQIRVGVVDKRKWTNFYTANVGARGRLMDSLSNHFAYCEDELICGQRLLVDTNRGEKGFIRDLTLSLRRSNAVLNRQSFKKIAARPDNRTDAGLVQVADMYAGYFRAFGDEAVRTMPLNSVVVNFLN